MRMGNDNGEKVEKSKYPKTLLTEDSCITEEIKAIIYSINICLLMLLFYPGSRKILRNLKIQLYNTIIQSVLFCGCES